MMLCSGYMAPEYAFDGLFSIKSDVFSFGILVLEIISGKKSRGFHHYNHGLTLIGHVSISKLHLSSFRLIISPSTPKWWHFGFLYFQAWTLLKEGRPFELLNKSSISSYDNLDEVLRCIHIGLLCVQQNPVDRPSMSSVVLMLGSQSELPQPKAPGYFTEMDSAKGDHSSTRPESSSTNDMSITLLEAR